MGRSIQKKNTQKDIGTYAQQSPKDKETTVSATKTDQI